MGYPFTDSPANLRGILTMAHASLYVSLPGRAKDHGRPAAAGPCESTRGCGRPRSPVSRDFGGAGLASKYHQPLQLNAN